MQYRLSGGALNSNPNASLGGAVSSTQFVHNTTGNLFDNVTGAQSQAGSVEYRLLYVVNTDDALAFLNGKIWLSALTPSPDSEIDIGIAQTPPGTADEQLLPTEAGYQPGNVPPTGVTFSRPTSEGTGLPFGASVNFGHKIGIWFRRTVNAGASAWTGDTFSWQISGETTG